MNRSTSATPPGRVPPEDAGSARPSRRAALPALAATALALGQVALAAPGHAATFAGTGTRVAVGHAPRVPGGAVASAAPAGSTKLTLDIQLNTPNSAALKAVADTVNDPKSPNYHHFLAAGDIAKDFGASAAEVSAVDAALKAAGLTPGVISSDGLFIPVTTTVAQAKAAFGTNFAGYTVAGRHVYANTSAPTFDAAVASDIAGVVGLDNIAYAVPQYVKTNKQVNAGHLSAAPHARASMASPHYAVPSCNDINSFFARQSPPQHDGTDYYTSDAISNIYGLNSVLAGGNNGSGVTVAVFELEAYDKVGGQEILNCYGSSSTVTEVDVDGGPSAAADLKTQVGLEAGLDIQNIADLAPGANILDYTGPDWNLSTTGPAQILDTYSKIVNDDLAQVISTSWGLCEAGNTDAFHNAEGTLFAQAAVQGQTIVAASGDTGSTDCYNAADNPPDHSLAVDDPASQPQVLGVGGTTMSGLTNPPQSTWNDVVNGTPLAGGGGVSATQPQPSFQQGVNANGYSAHCANAASTGCRQVPDVSAFADPNDGYVIGMLDSVDGGVHLVVIGGTSGAAPVWAAIYALADATSACHANGTNGKAGEAAPALYAAGATPERYSVFRDITSGGNGIAPIRRLTVTRPPPATTWRPAGARRWRGA